MYLSVPSSGKRENCKDNKILRLNIIFLSSGGWSKKLNGLHLAPGPQFAHACLEGWIQSFGVNLSNRTFICGRRGGATHSHVRSAARVSGFGDGVHQLTADAKVAQLDVAVPVEEDVGRLDVCEDEKTQR